MFHSLFFVRRRTYGTGRTGTVQAVFQGAGTDQVSFQIGEGEIFALIGPNGAGKTTTIRMIATLLQPTGGDAVVAGHSVCREPAKVRECITYLPDEAGAYKTMTGKAYLKFMASIFTTDRKQADACVQRAMAMCGLGDRLNEKIGTYSRGMIRKLLLSRAVMTRPKLAILDEPTSGLDVINALEIRKMILQLARDEGMSFLLSSHNMLEIEYVSGPGGHHFRRASDGHRKAGGAEDPVWCGKSGGSI